jgi:hypothetical protein
MLAVHHAIRRELFCACRDLIPRHRKSGLPDLRTIRASSAAENGWASGSERAAASISAGIGRRSGFALAALREVVILLIFACAPRRDQAEASLPLGIDNTEKLATAMPMSKKRS